MENPIWYFIVYHQIDAQTQHLYQQINRVLRKEKYEPISIPAPTNQIFYTTNISEAIAIGKEQFGKSGVIRSISKKNLEKLLKQTQNNIWDL